MRICKLLVYWKNILIFVVDVMKGFNVLTRSEARNVMMACRNILEMKLISTWVDRIVVGKIMTLNQYDLQNDKAWRELGTDDRQIEQVTIITMFLIRE